MAMCPQFRLVASVVVLAAVSSPAWAQRLAEPAYFASATGSGARALGMGGAFIAIADDATASSWNPAGLAVLERAEASLVFQPIARVTTKYPSSEFGLDNRSVSGGFTTQTFEIEEDDAYDLPRNSRSFDFASITVPLRLGSIKLVPQISYQRAVDMGLDYEYRSAYKDDVARETRNALGALTNTTVETGGGSYRGTGEQGGGLDVIGISTGIGISSKIYLGLAVNIWGNGQTADTTYNFERNATSQGVSGTTPLSSSTFQTSDQQRAVTEDFSGTNFQVGLLVKPKSWLSLGATYKSGFDMDYEYRFDGSVRDMFRSTSGSTTQETTTNSQSSTTRTGTVTWPASFGGGIAVMPKETLTLSLDATLTQWSKGRIFAQETFQSSATRTITRTGQPNQNPALTPTSSTRLLDFPWPVYSSQFQTEQPDGLQVRFGAEYVLRNPGFLKLQVLPLRVGLVRDRQLQRSYQQDGDIYYTGITTGVGLTWSRASLDFAYLFTRGSRSEDFVITTDLTGGGRSTQAQDMNGDVGYRASRFFVSTTVRF
jgi:long-subunit fatty acid transport protein